MAGDSLFERTNESVQPLAAGMRPRALDEFVGQNHIRTVGKAIPDRKAVSSDELSYGHQAGDRVLKEVAALLNNSVRSEISLSDPVIHSNEDLTRVTASFGVAETSAAIDTTENLFELADEMLWWPKTGRIWRYVVVQECEAPSEAHPRLFLARPAAS